MQVSVPCRGLTCFYSLQCIAVIICSFPSPVGVLHVSMDEDLRMAFTSAMFPSPVGVLHVSIGSSTEKEMVNKFPSPVGVLHVSIRRGGIKMKGIKEVSVPCRGLTCFYPAFCNALISRLTQCICG